MIILLILGILIIAVAICLGMALIHETDEKIGVIVYYFGCIAPKITADVEEKTTV